MPLPNTPNLGLTQWEGTDDVDVNEVNGNFTKIDSLSVPTVCTSATRPATNLFVGRTIYETDTKRVYFWDGSAWKHMSGPTPLFKQYATGATQLMANGSSFAAYTEAFGLTGAWDTVGGATAIRTVPEDGYYEIIARGTWGSASAANSRSIEIRKNMVAGNTGSGTRLDRDDAPGSTSSFVSVEASAIEPFNANDNFGVVVAQTSGANLDLICGTDRSAVTAKYLRPL